MAIIRQQVIDALELKLQAITFANGYSREVGTRRVYTARRLPQSLPTPAVILYQEAELVEPNLQERYDCALPISIAFIDTYGGRDPDVEAIEFASEVFVVRAAWDHIRHVVGSSTAVKIPTSGYEVAHMPTDGVDSASFMGVLD